jgi:hypothetical protein
LRRVDVENPGAHQAVLREIFDAERAWREGAEGGEDDEFEQVYLAAFLLFLIGDPADSIRLYDAKFRTRDMDLGIGLDAHAIFGAGREETLSWLAENGYADESAHLAEWLSYIEAPSSAPGSGPGGAPGSEPGGGPSSAPGGGMGDSSEPGSDEATGHGDDSIGEWARGQREYFYSPDGELLLDRI